MIISENLKAELLKKALTASKAKDTSKLVLIRKDRIGKNGKIVHQGYWVDPNKEKIEHHTKVLANHHNLPDGHPQKTPKTANTTSPMAEHTKDDVTIVADTFHNLFGNNEEFCDELKNVGIKWTEGAEPKTNVMRAKMALKAAIRNGFDPFKNKSYKAPEKAEPAAQKDGSEGVKMDMRTPVSDASKQAATDFFEKTCNKDRSVFYSKLESMGIKWSKSEKDGVNYMFAKRMLTLAIERGLDPNNPTTAAQIKPTETPKPKPDKDESLLEVPDNATEREKNLIKHINKLTKLDEIQGCTRVGIVPEDNYSKQYVLNKLQVQIATAVLNPNDEDWFKDVDSNGKKRFPPEVRQEIIKSWGQDTLENLVRQRGNGENNEILYDRNADGFGRAMADQLILDGCKKTPIINGFKQAAGFDMEMLVNPRNKISNTGKAIRPARIIKSLNEGYSDYTSDSYSGEYLTNLGYTGYSPTEYLQRYSRDKEGFVKYLTNIKEKNPEVTNRVNQMIEGYDKVMRKVDCNPHVLNLILSSPNWTTDSDIDYKLTKFGKEIPASLADATRAVKYADHMSNLVITELEKRGYSQKSILDALQNTEINDSLRNFQIENDNGKTETVDFTKCKNPDGTNAVVVRRFEHEWGTGLLAYTQAKYMEQNKIPLNSTNPDNQKAMTAAQDFYDMAKKMSGITEETYKDVHKSMLGVFGIKYVDANGNDLDYSTLDAKGASWRTPGIKQTLADYDPQTDIILSNLIYGRFFHDVNSAVSELVTNNAKGKMNDSGKDYSKNFDYYSGAIMGNSNKRLTQLGNSEATYTAAELSAKIAKQIDDVPNLSTEYLTKLKTYYATSSQRPDLDSFKSGFGRSTAAYLDNPIKDFMYQLAENVSSHTPITASKPTFSKLTAKRLNYVPFNFDAKKQDRLVKEKVKAAPPATPKELKAARQSLLAFAKCSLGTLDEDATRKEWKRLREEKFDYKKGEKTLFGETVMEPAHTVRDANGNIDYTKSGDPATMTINKTVLLNEPLFKVSNSVFEENFMARQKKMKDSGNADAACYTPVEAYTGTSYWSGANVCGRDGKFYMNQEVTKSGSMLGAGPYFGLTLGKVAQYIGNDPGAGLRAKDKSGKPQDLSREQADGLIIMSKIMLGERYVKNATASDVKSKFKTCLCKDASDAKLVRQYAAAKLKGTNPGFTIMKDIEVCVKDNALILPEIIADTSSRVYTISTNYDPKTGYHDPKTNQLTHDKDGISVNIKWK